MKVYIEIEQIDNGYVLNFFDTDDTTCDSSVNYFVKTKTEAQEILLEWWKGKMVGSYPSRQ